MATLAANVLTLSDWAKRLDPDGKVPSIVELLAQTRSELACKLREYIRLNGDSYEQCDRASL